MKNSQPAPCKLIFGAMKKLIEKQTNLPLFIAEKVQGVWVIWDTEKGEDYGVHFITKEAATKKADELNAN